MINFLLDELPKEINGLRIRTDFRVWIAFETYLQDPLNTLTNNLDDLINMIFIDEPQDYLVAFEELLSFKCMYNDKQTVEKSNEPLFDWKQDGNKVYSAFMRMYGINLRSIDYMHWWEFSSLFNDLGETCELLNAISYRGMDISKIKDKDERNRISKLKSQYELR